MFFSFSSGEKLIESEDIQIPQILNTIGVSSESLDVKIKIEIKSGTESLSCKTDEITLSHYYTHFSYSQLQSCRNYKIFGENAQTRVWSNSKYTKIDKIQISTNGRFIPLLTCEPNNGYYINFNAENVFSQYINCTSKPALYRIKTHTSHDPHAGANTNIKELKFAIFMFSKKGFK